MTTQIDWANASVNAGKKRNKLRNKSAGKITQGIDDLLSDMTLPEAAKDLLLQQIASVLENRDTLVGFLTGKTSQGTFALGTGSSDEDVTDERDRLKVQNGVLRGDRTVLDRILTTYHFPARPLNTPYDEDVPEDFASYINKWVADERDASYAKGKQDVVDGSADDYIKKQDGYVYVKEADVVPKTAVKLAAEKVVNAINGLKTSLTNGSKIEGKPALAAAVNELNKLHTPAP